MYSQDLSEELSVLKNISHQRKSVPFKIPIQPSPPFHKTIVLPTNCNSHSQNYNQYLFCWYLVNLLISSSSDRVAFLQGLTHLLFNENN
jgi:hypothetical protein